MSSNILIIMPEVLKARTSAHSNIDEKMIYPEIKAAQDMYVMPIIGSTLMTKLQTEIEANTLSGVYKTLVDDYLIDCICNYVLSEMPDTLGYQFYNKGVGGKKADADTQPNMSELYRIVAKYKTRAEYYGERCRKYLIQNLTLYPEYATYTVGIDTVPPDANNYTCGIYLGDESELPPDEYSLR